MPDLIDYRACVEYLRPTSEYHWRGGQRNAETGEPIPDTYNSIGEWRDPETTKPTEAEIAKVWKNIVANRPTDEEIAAKEDAAEFARLRPLVAAMKAKTTEADIEAEFLRLKRAERGGNQRARASRQ